nr:hypothetical protein [Tanacetum cinerariifolium]
MRARRFLQKTGRNLGDNRATTIGFDMSKVECYNCYTKGHFARECRSPKDTRMTVVAKPQRRHSYQAEEEPANFALMAISSSSSSDNEDKIIVLTNEVQGRDHYISIVKPKLKDAETERDDLKLKLEKFQSSSKNLAELIANQTNNKHGLGYLPSEDVSVNLSLSCPSDKVQPSGGYNVVPPPITGNFMPLKPDLVFNTAPLVIESNHSAFNVQLSPAKPAQAMIHTTKSIAPIIEDWVSNSEDESKPDDPQSAPSFVQPSEQVKHSGHSAQPIEAPILDHAPKPISSKTNCNRKRKNRKLVLVPAAVFTKSKPISVTAARPTSNSSLKVTAAHAKVVSAAKGKKEKWGNPQYDLKDKGVIDSGCSRHMTGNMSYLSEFQELNGGYVAFGGNPKGGKITRKGKIKTGKLDFEDVYFVKELKFNLFSVSQMCDKKNKVLFTDSECLVLSPDFKLPDESQVLLRVPRENNIYNVNLKDIVSFGDLTYLFAKAIIDESNLWHRRLGHVNFKTINKLVKGNLVRGLPTKVFENQNTCVACRKGKQHRASCKTKPVNSVSQPLFSSILKTFVTGIENQLSLKMKVIRSDNETEFKNSDLNQFFELKGIKREFSVPRTPQQNGIAKRKNRTLIEAARTMLADSLLPILFWAEAVNTACYVQNRVLVTKPQNKTPYELLHGRTPSIGFMRPFGCPVTILNTLDSLGKFKGNVDEGFIVGYSVHSKAFRVFNSRTSIIQETLHVNFLENTPNVAGTGPTWLFDIDSLTRTMNYQPVTIGNQTNPNTSFQEEFDVGKIREEANQQYMLFPVWSTGSINLQNKEGDTTFDGLENHFEDFSEDSSNDVSDASPIVPAAEQNCSNNTNPISAARPLNSNSSSTHGNSSLRDSSQSLDVLEMENIVYSDNENVGAEADFNNLESSITVSPIPTTRTHNAHPISQIIGNLFSTTQTRSMARIIRDQGRISQVLNEDFHTCMFACFLSQEEPKRVHQALKDSSWIEAMQEELLQFKMKKVGILVDLPQGKRKGDILLVQNYVDDIIFGATNKDLCKSFEKLMKDKFQMSSMGELTFFLSLQVKQKEDGIFINQDKYVAEILKKFGLTEGKSASTPIDTKKPLLKDPDGEDVDVHIYRSMIGSLMYLTSSRPDIMFAVCTCVRFQVTLKVSHLNAVKRIFRYLKGKPHLGLWYLKDSPFDLVAYSNSDYADASLDRKSTTGGCQFLGSRLISWQCKKQTVVATSSTEAEYLAGASYCA